MEPVGKYLLVSPIKVKETDSGIVLTAESSKVRRAEILKFGKDCAGGPLRGASVGSKVVYRPSSEEVDTEDGKLLIHQDAVIALEL